MIKCVVFDMAGTTVKDNGNVARFMSIALQSTDFYFSPKEVGEFMGMPKIEAIRRLLEKRIYKVHTNFVNQMVEYYINRIIIQ